MRSCSTPAGRPPRQEEEEEEWATGRCKVPRGRMRRRRTNPPAARSSMSPVGSGSLSMRRPRRLTQEATAFAPAVWSRSIEAQRH